jgi:hypothetical protein
MLRTAVAALAVAFALIVAPLGADAASSRALSGAPAADASVAGPITPSAAMPSSFRALSVTFVSSSQGWVLGSVTCPSGRCPALAHTVNAGHTWSLLPGPPTTVNTNPGSAGVSHGVGSVRFANSHDGWAFGPELWATHDGGHTWAQQSVFGGHGGPVLTLETARGTAHAVLYDGLTHFRIATTAVAADAWRVVHLALAVGAGPVPEVQIVLSGATGWVLQNDRTVVNGARLLAGAWVSWRPACLSVVGPAQLAASDPLHLFAVCDVGLWSTPAGEHVYRSTNGGISFARRGTTVPTYPAYGAAAATSSTIVVAGLRGSSSVLEATFDGGFSWRRVLTLGSGNHRDLGFTTSTQGVLVDSNHLYITRDGGHTWSRIAF